MKARLKLKPGQKGTKGLVDIYGDTLVCVRYRYDEATKTRYKTVELIIEKAPWNPPSPKWNEEELVPVQIAFAEKELKDLAKAAGGRWDPDKRCWLIKYGRVKNTKLEMHIIVDTEQEGGP